MNIKLNKKRNAVNYPVSCSAANNLKIYHTFTIAICCSCIEFHKHYMNIYQVINILSKNFNFLCLFRFLKKIKAFYSNFTILAENVTKYTIKFLHLEFKRNRIILQRNMDIFSKYCFTVHMSMIADKFFWNSLCIILYNNLLKKYLTEYPENWKKYSWFNHYLSAVLRDA